MSLLELGHTRIILAVSGIYGGGALRYNDLHERVFCFSRQIPGSRDKVHSGVRITPPAGEVTHMS